MRRLRSRLPWSDAEDVWQDASVKFLQHAATLTGADSPTAWMSVVLRRLVVDRYRRAARERRQTKALAAESPSSADDQSEDEAVGAPITCMTRLVSGLRPEYAEILTRTYLQDRPVKTVAQQLGVTGNNAAVRLHRARGALRAAMVAGCEVCPLRDCWAKARLGQLSGAAQLAPTWRGASGDGGR